MRTYVLRRVLLALPTLLGITMVVFGAQSSYDPRVIKKLVGGRAHEHEALPGFYGLTPGLTPLTIPSPVADDGIVIATAGFNGSSLKAVRLADARGDITGTNAIAWTLDRDTPYAPSPLLFGGLVYILKSNNGILSVFDAKTGTPQYRAQRLTDVPNIFASPVGADGRVYLAGADGNILVIRHGPKFEVLATNTLNDGFMASPALVDNEIYLRGNKFLYCIAEQAASRGKVQ